WQGSHLRAGGYGDGLRVDRLRFAVDERDLNLAGPKDTTPTVEIIDLVLTQQEGDAVDIVLHASVLEGEHGSEVELVPYLDSHAGEAVSGFNRASARGQQRLGRDAADIETGTAMSSALLHHCDLHAELSRTNGGDIAARTCADDDEVVSHANADSTTA